MLLWIKALFEKPEVVTNPEDFTPYTDIFNFDFLSDLFVKFQSHINQETFTANFQEKITSDLFQGLNWENSKKIMINLNIGWSDEEVAQFLEQLSYRIWFPQMEMSGHTFTEKEKAALAGFAFFEDGQHDEDYPYKTIDQAVIEMRSSHTSFIDFVFTSNLKGMVGEHTKFIQKECTV